MYGTKLRLAEEGQDDQNTSVLIRTWGRCDTAIVQSRDELVIYPVKLSVLESPLKAQTGRRSPLAPWSAGDLTEGVVLWGNYQKYLVWVVSQDGFGNRVRKAHTGKEHLLSADTDAPIVVGWMLNNGSVIFTFFLD